MSQPIIANNKPAKGKYEVPIDIKKSPGMKTPGLFLCKAI